MLTVHVDLIFHADSNSEPVNHVQATCSCMRLTQVIKDNCFKTDPITSNLPGTHVYGRLVVFAFDYNTRDTRYDGIF